MSINVTLGGIRNAKHPQATSPPPGPVCWKAFALWQMCRCVDHLLDDESGHVRHVTKRMDSRQQHSLPTTGEQRKFVRVSGSGGAERNNNSLPSRKSGQMLLPRNMCGPGIVVTAPPRWFRAPVSCNSRHETVSAGRQQSAFVRTDSTRPKIDRYIATKTSSLSACLLEEYHNGIRYPFTPRLR